MRETKTVILRLLREEQQSAGTIASKLHIQVSAARKHLEQLASLGLVSESFEIRGVGRPKKFYTLTEKGKELSPRHYDTLLNRLVTKIVERGGAAQAESIMMSIAADMAKNLDGYDPRNGRRGENIKAGINQLGFEASLHRNDGHLTVISRNCPIWKVALEQRETVCRGFHAELLKAAFKGKTVDRHEWMPDGDSYCKHSITFHLTREE